MVDNADANVLAEIILKTLFEKILEAETRGRLDLYLLNDAITANNLLERNLKNNTMSGETH